MNTIKPAKSIKAFCNKASAARSATAYLAAHKEFLTAGAHASVVVPLLDALANGTALPSPTLKAVAEALMAWELSQVTVRAAKGTGGGRPRVEKAFVAEVIEDGAITLSKGFDSAREAESWLDRRLDNGGPRTSGKINGEEVSRDAALARLYGAPRRGGPVMKRAPQSAPMKSKMKVSTWRAHFSRG